AITTTAVRIKWAPTTETTNYQLPTTNYQPLTNNIPASRDHRVGERTTHHDGVHGAGFQDSAERREQRAQCVALGHCRKRTLGGGFNTLCRIVHEHARRLHVQIGSGLTRRRDLACTQ